MKIETWKNIEGYETHYQVSTLGNIRSKERVVSDCRNPSRVFKSKTLIKWERPKGYLSVSLSKHGVVKKYTVHQLVAMTFLIKLPHHECVNHKNGDKHDNTPLNLEWCTQSENNQHAFDTGLKLPTKNKKGRHSHAFKGAIIAENVETGERVKLFGPEDMRLAGFNSKSVYSCISGKRNTHYGHTFERLSNEMV